MGARLSSLLGLLPKQLNSKFLAQLVGSFQRAATDKL